MFSLPVIQKLMEVYMSFYLSPCAVSVRRLGDKHEDRKYSEITSWREEPNPGEWPRKGEKGMASSAESRTVHLQHFCKKQPHDT
jgi:hypothetical protein